MKTVKVSHESCGRHESFNEAEFFQIWEYIKVGVRWSQRHSADRSDKALSIQNLKKRKPYGVVTLQHSKIEYASSLIRVITDKSAHLLAGRNLCQHLFGLCFSSDSLPISWPQVNDVDWRHLVSTWVILQRGVWMSMYARSLSSPLWPVSSRPPHLCSRVASERARRQTWRQTSKSDLDEDGVSCALFPFLHLPSPLHSYICVSRMWVESILHRTYICLLAFPDLFGREEKRCCASGLLQCGERATDEWLRSGFWHGNFLSNFHPMLQQSSYA